MGFATELVQRRPDTLTRQACEVFPAVVDWPRAAPWAGLRPTRPDWKPIPGPGGLDGLWLDIGHGGLGFTIGCGTGELLAAMIAGRATAIPVEPYAVGRDGRCGAEAPTAG